MSNKTLAIISRLLAGTLLLFAIGGSAYDAFYPILRVVVCSSSIYLLWYFNSIKLNAIGWLFLLPAMLFNPFAPLPFDLIVWSVLDGIFGVLFLLSLGADEKWKINWSDEEGKDGVSGMLAGLVIVIVVGVVFALLGFDSGDA